MCIYQCVYPFVAGHWVRSEKCCGEQGCTEMVVFELGSLGAYFYIEIKSEVLFFMIDGASCLISSLCVVNTMRTFQISWPVRCLEKRGGQVGVRKISRR